MEGIELYKHQKDILNLNPAKHLLAWEMGTGKTLAAIRLAEQQPIRNCLVICPKQVIDKWPQEVHKFSTRKDIQWQFLTKEQFKKQAYPYAKYGRYRRYNAGPYMLADKFDCLIGDEAHYFSGQKSALSKLIRHFVKTQSVPYIYLLTATPYMSSPWNIYVLAQILGRNWNYISYEKEFFTKFRMGHIMVPKIKKNIEPKIGCLVNRLGNSIRMDECVDMPEAVHEQEYFEATPEQKRAAEQLSDLEVLPMYVKEHQIMGGVYREDNYSEPIFLKSEKKKRIIEYLSEKKKFVLICAYKMEIDMLSKAIQDKGRRVYILDGRTKQSQAVIDLINADPECVAIINAQCSAGYEIPTANTMVFYSHNFSLVHFLQMTGRIRRANNPQKCLYISYVTKNTVDEAVYRCISNKEDFDVNIYHRDKKRLNY